MQARALHLPNVFIQILCVSLTEYARNITAVYLGSTLTMTASHTKIRKAVSAQCLASKDCQWKRIFHSSTDYRIASFLASYQHAVFCLNPPGDDSSRKGIFDSMVAGCIPVIFDVSTLFNQYPWHFTEQIALDVSVFIPGKLVLSGQVNVMKILRSIPKETILRKQQAIAVLAPSLQYSIPPMKYLLPRNISNKDGLEEERWDPPFPDAVDRTIDGMFRRVDCVLANRSTGIPLRLMRPKDWVAAYSKVRIQLPS